MSHESLTSFLIKNKAWLSAGVILTFLSSFGQTFFISIFAGKIQSEFGLSFSAWGLIYSLGTMSSAIVMLWAGTLTDRFRVRALGGFVLLGLAVSCCLMAGVTSWVLLPIVVFLLRLFGQGMASHIATVAMARWFVATRGRALAVATLGFSVGEAIMPVAFVFLFEFVNWRVLWLCSAVLCLFFIPVLYRLLAVERTPQAVAEESVSLGMNRQQWSRRDLLNHPLFWCLVPWILGPSAFVTAFFFQQTHFAEIKGLSHLELVAMFPIFTAVSVTSMVICGIMVDKFGAGKLAAVYQIPFVFGFVIFAFAGSASTILFGLILMAMSVGGNACVPAAFWAEFYGTRHLGAIKATATAVMVLGSALGPGITGVLIDLQIPLDRQFLWIGLWFLGVVLLVHVAVGRARKSLPQAP